MGAYELVVFLLMTMRFGQYAYAYGAGCVQRQKKETCEISELISHLLAFRHFPLIPCRSALRMKAMIVMCQSSDGISDAWPAVDPRGVVLSIHNDSLLHGVYPSEPPSSLQA